MEKSVDERLEALETRLARIEARLDRSVLDLDGMRSGVQAWVTDYV